MISIGERAPCSISVEPQRVTRRRCGSCAAPGGLHGLSGPNMRRRSASPALEKMLTELDTRTTARAISHYRASILNEEMRNPGKLDLRAMYERLPGYERDHLFGKIKEREESLAGRHPSLRETAPGIDVSRSQAAQVPRAGESFREYSSALADIERRLLDDTTRQKEAPDKFG